MEEVFIYVILLIDFLCLVYHYHVPTHVGLGGSSGSMTRSTYLNDLGRRKEQPRRDPTKAKDTGDPHIERARNLEGRREDGAHNGLHATGMGPSDDKDEVNGEFACLVNKSGQVK